VDNERQIAANRRNATKSTGPKTSIGKQRASGNSYRHGFSVQIDDEDGSDDLEWLARRIVGNATDRNLLQYARCAARAHFDLGRIRQIKVDMLNRVIDFGVLEPRPFRFRSLSTKLRYLTSTFRPTGGVADMGRSLGSDAGRRGGMRS
jgi:hypothetical protein